MSKRRKNSSTIKLPRTLEVHVENGFHGTVELVDHGDGWVSFAVPLPDHINRWLDQFDPLPGTVSIDDHETSDDQSTVH